MKRGFPHFFFHPGKWFNETIDFTGILKDSQDPNAVTRHVLHDLTAPVTLMFTGVLFQTSLHLFAFNADLVLYTTRKLLFEELL